jgi:uncharacterized membrane protein YdjX (TVP38/TMEM64 family)
MTGETAPGADSRPDEGVSWQAAALTAAIVVALGIAVLAINPLREAAGYALRGDTSGLREHLDSLGAGGAAILAGLMIVHTFIWFPAEIVDAAAGFVYGFWLALPLVMIGWTLQGLLAYAIGRVAARPVLTKFIGHQRFSRVERMIEHGGVTLLLAARMVPIVPFSLFSYVAGATAVPVGRFTWTTAVGYIPITGLFVYLGTRLETLSPTDPAIWGVTIAMIGLLLLTRHLRPQLEPDETGHPSVGLEPDEAEPGETLP